MAMADHSKTLPGTAALNGTHDYGRLMLQGLNNLLDSELAKADAQRQIHLCQPGTAADIAARAANCRQRLARYAGVVDARSTSIKLELVGDVESSAMLSYTDDYAALAIRWPVFNGVDGEGIFIRLHRQPVATVIAIPDADCPPEVLTGILPGMPSTEQFTRRLLPLNCQVVVPALIDRDCRWSGNPDIRFTNQPHREFIYRMAFQMGRHIIGYEVQKILALVDYFKTVSPAQPVLVFGYGEGGLLALYSAALDERIDAVGVSGYFSNRYQVWQEPIYRNVWRLLRGCSDAEIAACIAPRPLLIEASAGPRVSGPPTATKERNGAAPGVLQPVAPAAVAAEAKLVQPTYTSLAASTNLKIMTPPLGQRLGCMPAFTWLLSACGISPAQVTEEWGLPPSRRPSLPAERQQRQVAQLITYTQQLWHRSDKQRRIFWQAADPSSPDSWQQTTQQYRRYFHEEVIGLAPPAAPMGQACSRLLEDTVEYSLYEVVLEVWPQVPAFAYLLVPKMAEVKPRPVVVCQHGLGGNPHALLQSEGYRSLARTLAAQGYVTLAPLNPSIGPAGDAFRVLQRKANPLGCSLFSFITAIHQHWLAWLAEQPFVDASRVALYGLSYGGKTALRVPALLNGYAMAICSGDFNEWVMKTVSVNFPTSYMFTGEYEIPEFDLGNTFNHAEMAYLIAPRPFMVERGHYDPCSEDEWVAGEYAKVRRLYDKLGLGECSEIEFFNGGHEINLQGTLQFIHRHLGRPNPD